METTGLPEVSLFAQRSDLRCYESPTSASECDLATISAVFEKRLRRMHWILLRVKRNDLTLRFGD